MNPMEAQLRETYAREETENLVELSVRGGLTEVAERVLREELAHRNVSSADIVVEEQRQANVAAWKIALQDHPMTETCKLYRQLKIAFLYNIGSLTVGLFVAVLLASYHPKLSQGIWVGALCLSVISFICYAYIYWRLCRYLNSSTLWLLVCCFFLGPLGVIITFLEMRSLVAKERSET